MIEKQENKKKYLRLTVLHVIENNFRMVQFYNKLNAYYKTVFKIFIYLSNLLVNFVCILYHILIMQAFFSVRNVKYSHKIYKNYTRN